MHDFLCNYSGLMYKTAVMLQPYYKYKWHWRFSIHI